MAKEYQIKKVAIEIHEDDWNEDLQVFIYNGDKCVDQYDTVDLEVIKVFTKINHMIEEK